MGYEPATEINWIELNWIIAITALDLNVLASARTPIIQASGSYRGHYSTHSHIVTNSHWSMTSRDQSIAVQQVIVQRLWNKQCGRRVRPTRYAPALPLMTFDRLTLKLVCESHIRWGTFFSFKFGHARALGSRIMRYVRDGRTDRQTDVRTKATLIVLFPTRAGA